MSFWQTDALGSVRQLADSQASITLAKSFEPYGELLSTVGSAESAYGFAGEWLDNTGQINLRARYYQPGVGRFSSKDQWSGDSLRPLSQNGWNYVEGNPINFTDPSGHCPPRTEEFSNLDFCWQLLARIEIKYPFIDLRHNLERESNNAFTVAGQEARYWTTEELNLMESELGALQSAMHGANLTNFFSPNELKVNRTILSSTTCGFYYPWNQIDLNSKNWANFEICHHTLVHELGHAVDADSVFFSLSEKFADFVGSRYVTRYAFRPSPSPNFPPLTYQYQDYCFGLETPPSYGSGDPPNKREDFAESFSEYVFDDETRRILPTESRYNFMEYLFSHGNPPPNLP